MAKRKREIEELKAAREAKRVRNAAWSQQTNRQQEREHRKEKRARRREAIKKSTPIDISSGSVAGKSDEKSTKKGQEANGRASLDDGDEWEELAHEERMAKKVKRGLVDKATFEKMFGDGL